MHNLSTLISIVLAVKNGEDYLTQTLESIFKQSFNFNLMEIIIINDGSNDSTTEIIQSFINRNIIKIIHIYNNQSIGQTKSLNIGIKKSAGKYICRIDADDLMHKNRIEKQYKFLEENKNCILIGSNYRLIDENNTIIHVEKKKLTNDEIRYMSKFRTILCHPTVMFRKYNEKELWLYSEKYRFAQDAELFLRMIKIGDVKILEDTLTDYRYHSNAVSNKNYNEQMRLLKEILLLNNSDTNLKLIIGYLYSRHNVSINSFINIINYFNNINKVTLEDKSIINESWLITFNARIVFSIIKNQKKILNKYLLILILFFKGNRYFLKLIKYYFETKLTNKN